MIKLKRFLFVVKQTGMRKVFISFILFLSFSSFLLWLIEPEVRTIGDGFWYCFVSSTTIGFGDICAVTMLGKVITIVVSVYGIVVAAMIPGVVVSYYMEYLKIKNKETISMFLEKLERLPELSREELAELSEKVRKFNRK